MKTLARLKSLTFDPRLFMLIVIAAFLLLERGNMCENAPRCDECILSPRRTTMMMMTRNGRAKGL